jgi:predicted molibdopterin-dependent oxidoreductase YjgC
MFTRLFRLTLLGSLDRWIVDPDASRHIASLWRIREDDLPGPGQWRSKCCRRSAMTAAFAGVFGSNVAVSAPDARRIQQRLRKLDLLVVSDFLLSETAALADVVRRSDEATSFRRAILATSSTSCGSRATGVQPTTRASRTNGFAATDGLFWPCPDLTHPGTPRLFIERFPTPSGRARFHAVHHDAPAEAADEHYPLYLTTGRLLAQYQSGTQTRPIAELQPLAPTAFAEVHPATAARLGLSSGGEIALTTRRGTTQLPGRVTPSIREDTVFVPFHWGGAQSIHRLTNPVLDPISRMPEFKVCAVEAQTVATARPGHDRLPTEERVRVCDCNGVTRARIVEAVLAGARSLQSVRCHQGRHRLRLVPAGGAGGDRCDVQPAGYDGQPHPSGPSAGSGPEGCGRRSERLGEAIAGRRRQRHGRCGLPGWSRPVAVTWPNLAFR